MNSRMLVLGTLAYVVVTFPLAVVWHIGLFKPFYLASGYLPENPGFLLGLTAIFIQGYLLTWGFTFTRFSGTVAHRALKYAAWLGVFFWSSHVIALMAKSPAARSLQFLGMESFYLFLQFGIYGLLLGWIYRRCSETSVG